MEVLQSLIELIYSNWLLFVSLLCRVTLEGCDARQGNGACFVPPRDARLVVFSGLLGAGGVCLMTLIRYIITAPY